MEIIIKLFWTHGFQKTFISRSICGSSPFARFRKLLSFRRIHFLSPFFIHSSGTIIWVGGRCRKEVLRIISTLPRRKKVLRIISTLPRNSYLWSLSSSYTVTSRTSWISCTSLEGNNVVWSSVDLQRENFLPNRRQGLVLSVGGDSVIHNLERSYLGSEQEKYSWNLDKSRKTILHLQDCKGIALAPNIGRTEPLGFDHFDHQVADILHLVEGVGQSLVNSCQTMICFLLTIGLT